MKTKHTPTPWRFFEDTRFGPWNTTENKQGNPHYYQWWIESDSRKLMALLEVPYLSKSVKHSEEVKREHAETLKEVKANAQFICKAVNHHEELVAALEVHASSLETCLASPTRAKIWREVAEINAKHIRSLLTKLKG